MSLADLRARMSAEQDVKRVLELEQCGGLYHYMIETNFATFPKFVIGTTDEAFDDVRPIFKCGEERNARAAWDKAVGAEDNAFREALAIE